MLQSDKKETVLNKVYKEHISNTEEFLQWIIQLISEINNNNCLSLLIRLL